MSSSSSAFERITSTVLESAEQIANRIEEGLSVIMTGALPSAQDEQANNDNHNNFGGPDLHNDEDTNIMMDMDDDTMMGSPLEGIADGVLKDLMNRGIGPQTPWEHVQAFCAAIRWTEPFLVGLIVFQIIMFGLSYYVSRKGGAMVPRLVIMITIGILVRSAEYANDYASRHWERLGMTQNYFDRGGIFVGIMVCGPLLLDCFIMLTMLIREASTLLIDVKRMEIKKKTKKSKNNKKDHDNTDGATTVNANVASNTASTNRGKKTKAKKDD